MRLTDSASRRQSCGCAILHEACLCFIDHTVDCLNFGYELLEHFGQQRLRAVRQRVLRVSVNLHHYSVCPDGYGGARERNDLMTLARPVRRIDDYRKVRPAL